MHRWKTTTKNGLFAQKSDEQNVAYARSGKFRSSVFLICCIFILHQTLENGVLMDFLKKDLKEKKRAEPRRMKPDPPRPNQRKVLMPGFPPWAGSWKARWPQSIDVLSGKSLSAM